jgi:hypothetical protein
MSHYLRNLIVRHRTPAAGPGSTGISSDTVQPRLRARFEGGVMGPAAATTPAADAEPPADAGAVGVAIAAPEAHAAPAVAEHPAGGEHPAGAAPGRLRTDEPRPTGQSPQPAPHRDTKPNMRNEEARDRAGQLPQATETGEPSGQTPGSPVRKAARAARSPDVLIRRQRVSQPPVSGRSQRERRNPPPAPGPGPETPARTPDYPPPAHADRQRAPEPPATRDRPAATVVSDFETVQHPFDPRRPGVLQAPDWVAEIQAALRNRQGTDHAPAEPEPTVNVTIGRIDVRAVRQQPRKTRSAGAAPKPIMSLDDYLEKRNGRQR